MDKVFVDSNVFIGILNTRDALHKKALRVWETLRKKQYRIVVSNFVISEVITVLSQRASKQDALEFAYSIYFDDKHEIELVHLDENLEFRTLEHFKAQTSKNVSFVDASNLAIMEAYKIKKIASFDKIFRKQKGIEIVI